ncbi:unnamed protein product [Rhizophagus irregularis]|uniref:Uncharacterized protein n=1 Tax=Rhizophagus irregularis TaxID=588596 RepID=A0A915ZC17_9GLOM|nr:unnamed protein product [Rhizophagus irregularis]CAB5369123.1 unnamed protein product [Rhizophagus irregularis]
MKYFGLFFECSIEEFMQKIEAYITSLRAIADTQEGRRSERAKEFLNNYKKDDQLGPVKGFSEMCFGKIEVSTQGNGISAKRNCFGEMGFGEKDFGEKSDTLFSYYLR